MTGSATTEVPQAVQDAASGLDLERLTADLCDGLMEDVFHGRRTDREFSELVTASTLGNLGNVRDVLAGRTAVADTRPTAGALRLADATAELHLPEALLERAYRSGQNRFWVRWFETAADHAQRSGTPLTSYLGRPSEQLFAYIGHVLEPVGAAYRTAADRQRGGPGGLRAAVLARLVEDDDELTADDVERVLGYPPGSHHAYVVLRPGDGVVTDDVVAALRRAVGGLAVLPHREGLGEWGVWIALAEATGPGTTAQLRRGLAASGVVAALAGAGPGVDGMRRARARALQVVRVQRALGDVPAVVGDRDVRLETLLLDDPERADGFVRAELGSLAGRDERAARLRSTLLTWLSTGSHVSTAATLGVHEHTVRNRIREIEAVLGAPVAGRRAELQVALRLHRLSDAPRVDHPSHSAAPPA
jgi:hypothetical protein